MVAYGNGISDDGLANFNDMTSVGGHIFKCNNSINCSRFKNTASIYNSNNNK